MPLYSCCCDECGSKQTYVRTVAERHQTPTCHGPMTKTLDTPMVSAMAWSGHKGFNLPGGGWIEDGAAFKKHMDKNGLIPESEGKREAEIQKTNIEAANDKKLDAAVTQAVMQAANT